VIYVTGDTSPSFPEQRAAFPGSSVFVADADAARALAETPSAEVAGAIGGGRAFVWVAGGRPVASIRYGDDGRVSDETVIDVGALRLRIGRGALVTEADGNATIQAGDGEIAFGARGTEAAVDQVAVRGGRLELSVPVASTAADVSMRYFYGVGSTLAGIRYPVLAPSSADAVRVSLDPARPDDARVGTADAAGGAAFASGFSTPLGGAVTLAPAGGSLMQAWDPVAGAWYLTPYGPWQLGFAGPTAGGPHAGELMLGLQGLEYARVLSGSTLRFAPGPAYAPGFGGAGPLGLTAAVPGSATPVETAWVYCDAFGPTGIPGLGYYAQPDAGCLFIPSPTPFQPFPPLPMLAGGFPASAPGGGAPSFPAVPYAAAPVPAGGAGPTGGWVDTLAAFEESVLGPARRGILQALNGPAGLRDTFECAGPPGPTFPTTPTGASGSAMAVTQQGMISTFANDYSTWNAIDVARSGDGGPSLVYTELGETMRSAMLANDLFLVISDAAAFEQACSTTYVVTEDVLGAALLQNVPQETVNHAWFMLGTLYYGVDYFQCALKTALGAADYATYGDTFTTLAESARLTISGWTFDLSPRRWSADTILVIKVCARDLVDVAGEVAYWTMPAAFNQDPAATAATLKTLVATSPDVGGFGATLRNWNGVLYLNCNVNTSELPPQLEGLAAGIPTPTFTAHHLGINLSPVTLDDAGALRFGDSSLFAAIDYVSPGDLEYHGEPYAFKVSLLRVAFENSQIVSFSSTLQLLIAELFLEPAALGGTQGGILVFVGSWQKHGQTDSYSFTFQGENVFSVSSFTLETVEVDAAQFVTVQSAASGAMTVTSRFVLSGTLSWRQLPFDIFSFGTAPGGGGTGLAFSNLVISLQFPRLQPTQTTYTFIAGEVGLVAAPGAARPGSLYDRLPLTVVSMVQGTSAAFPASLGYAPVTTPLVSGSLGPQWFGLELSLNLGSAGALAAAGGLAASLLLSWAPSATAYDVGVGMHLPGAGSSGKTITLEGPLTLGVRDLSLFPGAADDYLLQMGTITLGFFGLQFPRGGSTNLLLFGNPDPRRAATSLGWYAAYQQDGK